MNSPSPLPPLNALRAFEVAARHLSFTRAASELGVTQTAISHQIKLLEEHLAARLFQRLPRRLVLTRAGAAWAHELRDIFARLHDANRRLREQPRADRPVVSVSVVPSFAARWLVPRLGRFLEQNPGFDVRISASEHLVDFEVEAVDIGIRYGTGRYPGLVVNKLTDDALVVVCAPALLGRHKLTAPRDLRRHVLLHDDTPGGWRAWLKAHAVPDVQAETGSVLVDSSMLVEAAVRGQGVALARLSLALDDLASGRLIRPFPRLRPTPAPFAYYIVAPRDRLQRAVVVAFRDWLRSEAGTLVTEIGRHAAPGRLARNSP
jgi:LysR family transcriptional regulator, glycine cleavage system transcriptional activator